VKGQIVDESMYELYKFLKNPIHMKQFSIKLILLIVLVIFTNSNVNCQIRTTNPEIFLFKYSKKNYSWIVENGKSFTPTREDLLKIEKVILKGISEQNPQREEYYNALKKNNPDSTIDIRDFILDLKNYKRQYVCAINHKGEKIVWVNCFCNSNGKNPKKQIISVNDGGNCFFGLYINLTNETYYDFIINGDA
jgi:hypothetical protein